MVNSQRTPHLNIGREITSRIGLAIIGLSILLAFSTYLLQSSLNFPEILVEKSSLAYLWFSAAKILALVGFMGLLLSGLMLWFISLYLKRRFENPAGNQIFLAGSLAAFAWIISALIWLAFTWFLNSNTPDQLYIIISRLVLVLYGITAPLLLSYWILRVSRLLQAYRLLGLISAIGLLFLCLSSVVWLINSLLPVDRGFYTTAEIFSLLAVLGRAIFIVTLFLIGLRLIKPVKTHAAEQRRKNILKWMGSAALFSLGLVFILVYSLGNILAFTYPKTEAVPSEPSLTGALLYQVIWIDQKLINPTRTIEQMRAQSYGAPQPLPAGVSLENLAISGVPAQYLCAPGATKGHVILYLHGGGFVAPLNDHHRVFTAGISQATGACVLLPEYRLAPENPFPAGLQDCLLAYHWLLDQGLAPAHIVIMGESAGASLTLAVAISIRDQHEALPAALVPLSPSTDLTMTGPSYQSKALVDPILGNGLPQQAYAAYTNNQAQELTDPLVSPLFADLHGLPPTFLLVGTQEVLLSDSMRMAEKMRASEDEVKIDIWPGMWHTWPMVGNFVPDSKLATQQIVYFIQQKMGQ